MIPAPVRAIALATIREAVRDRILYLLLVFALAVIAVSRFVSLLTVGDEAKIVKDLGLAALSLFGVMTAMFTGVSLVFKEIERRTIYTLLAAPVRRWHFVVGKYAGLLGVLTTNAALMYTVLAGVLLVQGESPRGLAPAVVLVVVELALVAAFAVLFSSFTNPILAAVGTLAVYVAGHLVWSFELLEKRLSGGFAKGVCAALRWALPNLDRLDVKAAAVHGAPIPPAYVGWGIAYGLLYAAVVLAVAAIVFERRDFHR